MVDSHNAMIVGILLAVVVVGIGGLYFSFSTSSSPSVIYVEGGSVSSSTGKLSGISKPFSIFAKGHAVTGRTEDVLGSALVTMDATISITCPQCTMTCTAKLAQDDPIGGEFILYTCNDATSVGGTINCGGTTTSATCSSTNTFGAFYKCNIGQEGALQDTLLDIKRNGVTDDAISLSVTIYNSNDDSNPATGCVGTCNNCPAQGTPGCIKDLIVDPTITVCDEFDTSNQCLCECFDVRWTDADTTHGFRNGETLEFSVENKLVAPAVNCAGGP